MLPLISIEMMLLLSRRCVREAIVQHSKATSIYRHPPWRHHIGRVNFLQAQSTQRRALFQYFSPGPGAKPHKRDRRARMSPPIFCKEKKHEAFCFAPILSIHSVLRRACLSWWPLLLQQYHLLLSSAVVDLESQLCCSACKL